MATLSRLRSAAALVLALPLLYGCGGGMMYQASHGLGVDPDAAQEINDDDVRKAFEAKPQLPAELSVAYFSFDASKADDVEKALREVPGVTRTYRIPPIFVTGERRFDEPRPWDPRPAQALSIKKLRLLAARAKCDAVVVVDYGYRVSGSPNGFVALNVLLVPMLFTPWLDHTYESYFEAFLVDTRNGYLYGHVSSEEKAENKRETIYADTSEAIDRQWVLLRGELKAKVSTLVGDDRARSVTAPPSGSGER